MHTDPILRYLCEFLMEKHGAHTIMLYGSRANGSATVESDYDVIAFAPVDRVLHDARLHDGQYLDVFVYPEQELAEATEDFLHIRQAQVLQQRDAEADAFLAQLDVLYEQGPSPLSSDEIVARITWINKMLVRAQRGDPEGNYRQHWLLFSLLEDYFQLRRQWYQGPKKALAFLALNEPVIHASFVEALKPSASFDLIQALATAVINDIAQSV